jgi:hypothetical protein
MEDSIGTAARRGSAKQMSGCHMERMKIKDVARIDSEENNLGMKCYLIRIRVRKRSVQSNRN